MSESRGRMQPRFQFGVAALFSVFSGGLAHGDPLVIEREIRLKPEAQVWSQTVCLSDLAEDAWLQGRCSGDGAACCRWTLAGAGSRVFTRAEIAREVSRSNWGGYTLALGGADEITVTQVGRELTSAEIAEKIVAAAAARFGESLREVTVGALKTMGPVRVSLAESRDWDVALPENLGASAIKVVSTRDAERFLGWVSANVRVDGEIYVARRAIRPTEPIQLQDFELRRADVAAVQARGSAPFHAQQFPAAVRARLTIPAGSPLTAAAIERAPMVRLGEAVTLILRSDNLRITTKGVAQGSAAIGDMVTVQLSRYNRSFRGRLMDGRSVEVWL